MILISHCGNLDGSQPEYENQPDYLFKALAAGFEVKVDVWHDGTSFKLGAEPTYFATLDFLRSEGLWCQCRNAEALRRLAEAGSAHYFWHEQNSYSLTNWGFVWTHPNIEVIPNKSIALLPETNTEWQVDQALGLCSDVIANYR